MPSTWNVQPYQYLSELRYNYIRAAAATTRKEAKALAREAEAWMKENAPWKDRPSNPKTGFVGGQARKGLRARVDNPLTEEQQNWFGFLKRQAIAKDIATRAKLNAQRKAKGQIRLAKVPKGQSAVQAVEMDINRAIGPVVRIVFTQSDRLSYTIWLEIANQGRYSILRPTLDRFGPEMARRVKRIANLKQFRDMNLRENFLQEATEEERFEKHVRGFEKLEGRKYVPWSPERQAKSVQRKSDDRRRARNRARR